MARDDRTNETTGETPMGAGQLVELDDSDFEVADGYPDPKGWDVIAGSRKVGEVKHLLADIAARRVRYLVVKLDRDVAPEGDRQVLVPVGLARLDDDEDRVQLPGLAVERLTEMRAYTGELTRDLEDSARRHLAGDMASTTRPEGDYYGHDHFDEGKLFQRRGEGAVRADREARIPRIEEELDVGKRRVQTGEVDVRKTIDTKHVAEQVPVAREEVEVERRPVRDASAAPADLSEGEIRVPVREEEVSVEKRPVVKEEYVIRKRVAEETRPVEADLRRERIDVEKHGRVTDADRGTDRGADRPAP
ncbi:MAG TPA: DUF2382 domain-containing protein [Gemmatimonadaceae bacterium]